MFSNIYLGSLLWFLVCGITEVVHGVIVAWILVEAGQIYLGLGLSLGLLFSTSIKIIECIVVIVTEKSACIVIILLLGFFIVEQTTCNFIVRRGLLDGMRFYLVLTHVIIDVEIICIFNRLKHNWRLLFLNSWLWGNLFGLSSKVLALNK